MHAKTPQDPMGSTKSILKQHIIDFAKTLYVLRHDSLTYHNAMNSQYDTQYLFTIVLIQRI